MLFDLSFCEYVIVCKVSLIMYKVYVVHCTLNEVLMNNSASWETFPLNSTKKSSWLHVCHQIFSINKYKQTVIYSCSTFPNDIYIIMHELKGQKTWLSITSTWNYDVRNGKNEANKMCRAPKLCSWLAAYSYRMRMESRA